MAVSGSIDGHVSHVPVGAEVVIPRARGARLPATPRVGVLATSRFESEAVAAALAGSAPVATVVQCAGLDQRTLAHEISGIDVLLVEAKVDPNALAAALAACPAAPASLALVVVGVDGARDDLAAWVRAGAIALLGPDVGLAELAAAVGAAARGERSCSASVTTFLLENMTRRPPGNGARGTALLTPRELEIAALLQEGLSNKQIARKLQIQIATVKNHVHNVLAKLEIHSRNQTRI